MINSIDLLKETKKTLLPRKDTSECMGEKGMCSAQVEPYLCTCLHSVRFHFGKGSPGPELTSFIFIDQYAIFMKPMSVYHHKHRRFCLK